MYISWANSQVGISAGTVGAQAPRIGRIEKSEALRLRMLLEQSQDRVVELTMLLRESDHRIKNSLQIASSLMQAQARHAKNDELRAALVSAASRIRAIGMVHEALQASGGESTVAIGDLMTLMCTSMQDLCEKEAIIQFRDSAQKLKVPVSFARSLMLLVNEIIVNALRHAFPADTLGTISVSLERKAENILIVVKDDGIGMELKDSSHVGFGTDLMTMMTRQIGGTLVSDCTSGTCFTLTAPIPLTPDTCPAGTPGPATSP